MIKLSQPVVQENEINEIVKVLRSGNLVQGKVVEDFENKLKEYIQVKHAIAVSSGTAALHLALQSLKIGEGDAVFVPGFTFPATVNVVEIQKARPVIIDVDLDNYNINPELLETEILKYSYKEIPKAIIVVHEFGAPVDMIKVMNIAKKYNLYVIEDAACALGAYHNNQHVGTFGDVGCFSWHPRKAITTGEGGALVTNNSKIATEVKMLRNHGILKKDNTIDFIIPGYNYRLTEFQAALGLHQLSRFDESLNKRTEIINLYFELLNNNHYIVLPDIVEGHAWQTFMIKISRDINRDQLIIDLKKFGIETNIGAYCISDIHYIKNKYNLEDKKSNSYQLYKHGLALPLSSNLDNNQIKYISKTLLSLIGVLKND